MSVACARLGWPAAALVGCAPPQEGAFVGECDDGRDNDGNGAIDCAEPSCTGCAPPADVHVCVNEFMASNDATITDDLGASSDWIELHNAGRTLAVLDRYTVTDDLDEPTKHRFTDLALPAGGYRVLWADGAEGAEDGHLPFKLTAEGGAIGLYKPDGVALQEIEYDTQATDVSAARIPDCGAEWALLATATPGASNGPPAGSDP